MEARMKALFLTLAAAGLIALTGPAFSQSQATPGTGTEQATPAQPQAASRCACCKQMMTGMMQQGGMMGMQQRPTAPAPAQPGQ
jgi:hypothetical protein